MKEAVAIYVYFDGACPKCIRDRDNYLLLAKQSAENVIWFDITDREEELITQGIHPTDALRSLHIRLEFSNHESVILKELDAYAVLMQHTKILKPLGWLISLPVIKPILRKLYKSMVVKRLKKSGRI